MCGSGRGPRGSPEAKEGAANGVASLNGRLEVRGEPQWTVGLDCQHTYSTLPGCRETTVLGHTHWIFFYIFLLWKSRSDNTATTKTLLFVAARQRFPDVQTLLVVFLH